MTFSITILAVVAVFALGAVCGVVAWNLILGAI